MTTMLTLVCTIASAACAAVTVILSVRNMRPEPFFIVNGRVEARAYADWMIVVVNIGVGDMCDVRVSTPTKPDRVLVAGLHPARRTVRHDGDSPGKANRPEPDAAGRDRKVGVRLIVFGLLPPFTEIDDIM